jgi:phosphoserine phosphatase
MKSVLTLIAADRLDDTTLSKIREILPGAAAPDWLAPGKAADIAFAGLDEGEAETRVRALLAGAPVDLVVQPAERRRKKLLVADMDSTIVIGETLDELAAFAGLKDQIAAITARAMNGEIDFKAALRERVGLLAGLAETALAETYAHLELMPGAWSPPCAPMAPIPCWPRAASIFSPAGCASAAASMTTAPTGWRSRTAR